MEIIKCNGKNCPAYQPKSCVRLDECAEVCLVIEGVNHCGYFLSSKSKAKRK